MIRRLTLLLAGLLAASASAAVVEVNLPYKTLRLKDGMLFTDATVKSFNTTAGTVMLVVNRDLISLRTSLLPDELQGRLKELTPVLSQEELAAEKEQEAAERKRAADTVDRRQRMAEEEAQAVRAANRNLSIKVAEQTAVRADATRDEVAKFAEERARSYFKYQDDPYSNIGAVIGSDVFFQYPEPVPGWPGRYRVEGTANRQYINDRASGFGRGSKEFEMLIQTRDGKKPEIVEIRIK